MKSFIVFLIFVKFADQCAIKPKLQQDNVQNEKVELGLSSGGGDSGDCSKEKQHFIGEKDFFLEEFYSPKNATFKCENLNVVIHFNSETDSKIKTINTGESEVSVQCINGLYQIPLKDKKLEVF
ncbi:unnamed protein product [Caenorhabditis angaria]|uniref:C6 domain-containing protein n=1 Tax=Caenorhabditis angaria TaxID=860376 RepID=A0A9P1ISX7_9PELO|nr:unnamed protein product [Caenorhabditis angaria]